MDQQLLDEFKGLGINLFLAVIAWAYYRKRTVPLSARYSTFGPRFWTGFVDSCVLWPVGFFVAAIPFLYAPKVLVALLLIIESSAWLVYTVVMHGRYGQTVGKMVAKVRVVDFRTEERISWRQAWLREGLPAPPSLWFLCYMVYLIITAPASSTLLRRPAMLLAGKSFWAITALPVLWYITELLTMLTNRKRRALHDFIAGTVVVRTNIEESMADECVQPINEKPLQATPVPVNER